MLTYFLITWVVAFFALCIPLLFITKDSETIEKIYDETYKTNSQGFVETTKPLSEEYYKLRNKVSSITKIVVLLTGFLNLIFLISLPYIIDVDFNFPFHYNTYIICLIIIILLYIILNLLYPGKNRGSGYRHPLDFPEMKGGNKFIFFLMISSFMPGKALSELVLGKIYAI